MITLFEKFKQEDFLTFKKKEEKRLVQRFGDKNLLNFIKDGDIDAVKFLLNGGYDINKKDFEENLLIAALNNDQLEMFDLISKLNYTDYNNPIDSIHLPDIIGAHDYSNKNIVTEDMVEKLKIITKYGFNFKSDQHNLISLYLTESAGYENGAHLRKFKDGIVPFIDWLLENYPSNYALCEDDVLPNKLKKKYKYLKDSGKYNL